MQNWVLAYKIYMFLIIKYKEENLCCLVWSRKTTPLIVHVLHNELPCRMLAHSLCELLNWISVGILYNDHPDEICSS